MFQQNVILTPGAGYHPDPAKPLRDGDDISWMGRARVGDDQGNSSACTLFGIANWVGIMLGIDIPDAEIIAAWERARMRLYGNLKGGLTVPQAWWAAQKEGWLYSHQTAERVRDMSTLAIAPLLGCYEITEGWRHPNAAGCICHTDTQVIGYHLVVIAEHGYVGENGGGAPSPRILWIQNSWKLKWGYKGCGQLTEDYHRKYCKQLWKINP